MGVSFAEFMPPGFPCAEHSEVLKAAYQKGQGHSSLDEFAPAWNAVMYRYRTCCDASASFTRSVTVQGVSPAHPARYEQDRDLFVFFVSGESVLESLCYALWSWGSVVKPGEFPFSSPKEKSHVKPDRVLDKMVACYSKHAITASLGISLSSSDWAKWKEVRNVLAHRCLPGRALSITLGDPSGDERRSATWQLQGIPIDVATTTSRLDWLLQQLKTLIPDCREFVLNT